MDSSACEESGVNIANEVGNHLTREQDDDSAANVDPNDNESLRLLVDTLRHREQEILKEKGELEADFGLKRARFMELFKQKEDASYDLQKENEEMKYILNELRRELDESKSEVAILECTKENEIEEERRKCHDEIASLQKIIDEAMGEAVQTRRGYDREIARLKKIIEKLENEMQENKGQMPSDSKEGVLSVVTKTLVKKVPGLNAYSQSNENIHENLEDSMKKAQEDAEVLRSLVVPLEEEIRALKEKLRAADEQIQQYESTVSKHKELSMDLIHLKRPSDIGNGLDEKLKGLHDGLQAEKSSRSDLEMYVEVLQGQKSTLVSEADDLRKQLREVCEYLDKEKREHEELKQTWHMANDQFLEAHRMQAEDMKRIQSILTADQQKAFQELQKKDSGIIKDPVTPFEGTDSHSSSKRSSPISFPSSPHRRKSPSPARQITTTLDRTGEDSRTSEEFSFEISEKKEVGGKFIHDSLSSSESTEDTTKEAFSDREGKISLQETAHGRGEAYGGLGKRVVSEREWLQLQEEVKSAREKLNHPCDMCSNYETQLQKAQDKERELLKTIKAIERSNAWHKSDLQMEQQARKEVEDKLTHASADMQKEVAELYNKVGELEKIHSEMRQQYASYVEEVTSNMKELIVNREKVQQELRRLQHDNDTLVGKYTEGSRQMQNETIDLPNNMEEMHLMFLRLREDLIVAKVAKEYMEENLRSQILFMKEQAKDEQHTRDSTERMLTQEIDTLREKVGILESLKSQYELEQQRRIDLEKLFRELQQKHTDAQAKHRQIMHALQKRVEEGSQIKEKLEAEISELKLKVQTLQTDLDNGEAVQKDFVKLSQSLQVQLEKIRESEKEVRWQHEEDVNECSNCKQPFNVTRRKHHCRHCGKIFCGDCTSKSVGSGPNGRSSKVCDVCHTLLVRDTAPYFSTEPPHTPD